MRLPLAFLAGTLLLSGCGYIHFGRLPAARQGDETLYRAYSDLETEHKVLKQELALARKEADSLRAALDRGAVAGSSDAAKQLEETSRELATLRADYAKLKAERSGSAEAATTAASTEVEGLRAENTKLRQELAEAHQKNAELAEQLKTTVAQNEQAEASVSTLSSELLEQKAARERAEQATAALRTQLEAVMARAGRADDVPANGPATAPAIGTQANALSSLQNLRAPPSDAAPLVELRTSRARSTPPPEAPTAAPSAETAKPTPAPTESAPATRTYTVEAGDTLEKISAKVYGNADQWGKIYDANADLFTSGRGLKAGITLKIPENK